MDKLMNGCKQKFVYHHEHHGCLVLRCGVWKTVKKGSATQTLKWCYDCLDEFYEEYLKDETPKSEKEKEK